MKEIHKDVPQRCECGRVVAFMRDGKIYVKCKRCKREVEVKRPRTVQG